MKNLFLLFVVLLSSSVSSARVVGLDSRKLATYLRGTYGLNNMGRNAFEPGFPTTVSFPDLGGVNQAASAEIGLSFTTGITTRLGLEILYPQYVNQLEGRNAGSTTLMSVTSEVYSLIPQLNLELPFKVTKIFKPYMYFGVGYAVTVIKNTVSMSSSGQATFGVQDYIEEATAYSIMGQLGAGFEFALVDNIGLSFDAGYRYLNPNKFTLNRDAITPRGTVLAGQDLRNVDGSNRALNLSGFFGAATFRFYIY
jgi:opacity protein-like surface antigen